MTQIFGYKRACNTTNWIYEFLLKSEWRAAIRLHPSDTRIFGQRSAYTQDMLSILHAVSFCISMPTVITTWSCYNIHSLSQVHLYWLLEFATKPAVAWLWGLHRWCRDSWGYCSSWRRFLLFKPDSLSDRVWHCVRWALSDMAPIPAQATTIGCSHYIGPWLRAALQDGGWHPQSTAGVLYTDTLASVQGR